MAGVVVEDSVETSAEATVDATVSVTIVIVTIELNLAMKVNNASQMIVRDFNFISNYLNDFQDSI